MTEPEAAQQAAARAAIFARVTDVERADAAAKRRGDALLRKVLTAAILRPGTLPADILGDAARLLEQEQKA